MEINVESKSEKLITKALTLKATDLHVIPRLNTTTIQARIDQRLFTLEEIPLSQSTRLISHFKFLAGMDIGEKRRPQNGSIHHYLASSGNVHLRLSTLPSAYNEALAIRILPQETSNQYEHLTIFPKPLKKIYELLNKQQGLLLFVGPTGSGKTTLLYSLLKQAQIQSKRQIITLEDPIEKRVDHFLQIEINEPAGVTYLDGFKSILRHDPDVIMIGEIRDESTAHLAIRAALTGHLVLSTLHAKDTISCLYRLLEFGVKFEEMHQTLLGVVSQQLCDLVCPYCGSECSIQCLVRRKQRRTGVYETLCGSQLNDVMKTILNNSGEDVYFPKMNDYLKRAMAMGYIPLSQTTSYKGFPYEKA
ncbi:Flp pilus assembly complex ATPase component TadA [Alkalihalobacillus berkeleyi]|uniref:Flp pilus assembly complex ATPase component TadA n=1 Tax=Pseudalkalibacillus berkeleyi TaxID=1069813 RepID=A0ABS9GYY2_9BACL|nr:Flp pilus assembly complex ATPase component TadA [Pseudalkalibacillus berkeleyi]